MFRSKLIKKPEAVSEILREIGIVFFAAMFIEPIVAKQTDVQVMIIGLTFALASWIGSLSVARK